MENFDKVIMYGSTSTRARKETLANGEIRFTILSEIDTTVPRVGSVIAYGSRTYRVVRLSARADTFQVDVIEVKPGDDFDHGDMRTTAELVDSVLSTAGGESIKALVGQNKHALRRVISNAIVLAKREMALRIQSQKVEREEAGLVHHTAIASPAPLVVEIEAEVLPSVASTLEAVTHYIEAKAWDGRFERLVRGYRGPSLRPQSPLARGGYTAPAPAQGTIGGRSIASLIAEGDRTHAEIRRRHGLN